jgi:hypothetical protein
VLNGAEGNGEYPGPELPAEVLAGTSGDGRGLLGHCEAGRARKGVAAVFQISLKGVDNWWAKWLAGGREALVAQPRGRRVRELQMLDAVEQRAVLDNRPC